MRPLKVRLGYGLMTGFMIGIGIGKASADHSGLAVIASTAGLFFATLALVFTADLVYEMKQRRARG
jgi:hypothetical protein